MDIETLSSALDEILPDEKIGADILQAFTNSAGENEFVEVEFAEGVMQIPVTVAHTIVGKAYFNDLGELGMSALRAQVALGEMLTEGDDAELAFPQYCYVTLHYDKTGALAGIDFHQEVR